jgi:hypothetical protein
MPEVPPVPVKPDTRVEEAVAFNWSELNGAPESMVAGTGHVMVGVNAHPGGVHEYGFWRFKVVHGAHAPPWPVELLARLNVILSGSVDAADCKPLVVEKPVNPGLPAPGFDRPTPKK